MTNGKRLGGSREDLSYQSASNLLISSPLLQENVPIALKSNTFQKSRALSEELIKKYVNNSVSQNLFANSSNYYISIHCVGCLHFQ